MERFQVQGQTWPAHAANIMDTFHNHMEMFWTWDPAHVTSNGASLLDGTKSSGYCGQLAHAFLALLRAPAPHGFGVEATTEEYKPDGPDLFIANHPGPLFNLAANVLRHDWENQAQPFLPLYGWGNHIVVKQGDKYFDPCYNAIYAALPDMARYAVKFNVLMVKNIMTIATATATPTPGHGTYTFGNVQVGSNAKNRHPLAILIAPDNLPT